MHDKGVMENREKQNLHVLEKKPIADEKIAANEKMMTAGRIRPDYPQREKRFFRGLY